MIGEPGTGFLAVARRVIHLARHGRVPATHPLFDPAFYLQKYPDVAAAGVNPLRHYREYGSAESRQPHPLFDPAFYLSHNLDVAESGVDPLVHYLSRGGAEDRKPHPLFEPSYYRLNAGMGAGNAANPLVHFLKSGPNAAQPHPLFDCGAYLEANPEVAESGLNPLVHYLDRPSERDRFAASVALTNSGIAYFDSASTIQLDLDDVQCVVFCLETCPGPRRQSSNDREEERTLYSTAKSVADYLGLQGSVAVSWIDPEGATRWIGEPQQLPFFRGVVGRQVCAQLPSSEALKSVA